MRIKTCNTISVKTVLAIVFCWLLIPCFDCVSDEAKFSEALDLVERENYAQAVEILESLIPETENSQQKGQYCYVTATCYRKLGRWAKAVPYYQMALEAEEFMFADLARLHIATGYGNLHNYGAAIKWYESILTEHPDSSVVREARYQLGERYYKIERYEDAIRHYEKFTEDYPGRWRVRAAIYRMGCAFEELEKWSDAYVLYQGMLRRSVKDDMAQKAVARIRFLKLSYPAIAVTREDQVYSGLALYYAKQYEAAREELGKAISEPDDLSAKAAYFTAESYYKKRKYPKAIEHYTSVIKNYPQSEYVELSQFQIALCHRKAGREEKANALLAEFSVTYPTSDLADNAAFQVAEYHRGKEQYKEAMNAYGELAAKYPHSELADDALWNVGWCGIKLKNNDRSVKAFQQLLNEYPQSRLADSAAFWIGVNYERMGKWQAAADSHRKLMNSRAWYYSDRAKRRIDSLIRQGKISEETIQYEKLGVDDSVPSWQNINAPVPARIQKLADLRIFDDAVGELLTTEEAGEDLESVYYNLSMFYRKMGDFPSSWSYAWRLSKLPGINGEDGAMPLQLHRMLYPLAFMDIVYSNSKKNSVDPLLVMSIMKEESHYDPDAVSWVGALGLIQIMPATGREIAQNLKLKPYKTEMLLQPEINVRMGTWYFAGLADRLGKHVEAALTKENIPESERSYIVTMLAAGAYNGGESRVRRWVKEYGLKDIDEFVESIPIQQTRQYIKKVFNSYEVYKALHSDGNH